MKRYIKVLLVLLAFIPFIHINAKETFKINKYYVNSEIEIAGAVHVKELIEIEGDFSSYSRLYNLDIFKNKTVGKKEDLEGSIIYNPTGIQSLKVGIYSQNEITFNDFTKEDFEENITYLDELSEDKTREGYYLEESKDKRTYTININKKSKKKIVLYVDYIVTNVLVEHKDCAEFYYNFLDTNMKYDIKDAIIFVALPYSSDEIFEVWAHGNVKNVKVQKDKDFRGIVARITDYKKESVFNIRSVFDLNLFPININESKKSNLEALTLIKNIEQKMGINTERKTILKRILTFSLCILDIIYALIMVLFVSKKRKIVSSPKFKKIKVAYYILGVIILAINILFFLNILVI